MFQETLLEISMLLSRPIPTIEYNSESGEKKNNFFVYLVFVFVTFCNVDLKANIFTQIKIISGLSEFLFETKLL